MIAAKRKGRDFQKYIRGNSRMRNALFVALRAGHGRETQAPS